MEFVFFGLGGLKILHARTKARRRLTCLFDLLYTSLPNAISAYGGGVLHSKFVLQKLCRAPPPILNYFNHCVKTELFESFSSEQ